VSPDSSAARLRGASAERPALTVAPNARGAPDGVKRSLLSRSQEAHCSDEKWESPLLAHVCCQDGVGDAILVRDDVVEVRRIGREESRQIAGA